MSWVLMHCRHNGMHILKRWTGSTALVLGAERSGYTALLVEVRWRFQAGIGWGGTEGRRMCADYTR